MELAEHYSFTDAQLMTHEIVLAHDRFSVQQFGSGTTAQYRTPGSIIGSASLKNSTLLDNAPNSSGQGSLPTGDARQEPMTRPPPMSPTNTGDLGQPEPSAQQNCAADGDMQKRPRACEACRGLKVRCDFPLEAERCRRCSKARRQCIVTVPSRKRQRKTDSKVADLERRINDLTATLESQKSQSQHNGSSNLRHFDSAEDDDSERFSPHDFVATHGHVPLLGVKKRKPSFISDVSSPLQGSFPLNMPLPTPTADVAKTNSEYADVIDRGLITSNEATIIFYHFVQDMAKHLPAVMFPPNTVPGIIRKTMPVLFLTILSVASGQHYPEKQKSLTREVLKTLADRVLCRGEKSLELIQAMQLLSIWHISEDPKDTTTFQIIQLACSMAISMELNGSQSRGGLGFSLVNDQHATAYPGGEHEMEQRRAWLACYLLSGIISLPMRQPNTVRWSSYLDSSLTLLRKGSPGDQFYKVLCKWVDIQRLADRVAELSMIVSNLETNKKVVRSELSTILTKLRSFEHELDEETDCTCSTNTKPPR